MPQHTGSRLFYIKSKIVGTQYEFIHIKHNLLREFPSACIYTALEGPDWIFCDWILKCLLWCNKGPERFSIETKCETNLILSGNGVKKIL
jgi:hypothetical protein